MPSATQKEDRSPSPPPSAPVASTPGPRATAFINLYNSALSATLSSISFDSFAACFPNIATQSPAALKGMHATMTERLEGFAKSEFEVILRERRVVEGLNALEGLVGDARRRKTRASDERGDNADAVPAPPHTLPPQSILSARLSSIHASQQSQLNARLQTTQSQNAILAEKLGSQRREIEDLLGVLDRVVRDLEDAGDKLGAEVEMGLDGEAREAEEGMVEI